MKRRQYIKITSIGLIAGLAGCSETGDESDEKKIPYEFQEPDYLRVNNNLDVNKFDFPEGFSKDGLENFKTALGTESNFYETEGFKLEITSNTQTKFSSSLTSEIKYVSNSQRKALWEEETPTTYRTDLFIDQDRFVRTEEVGSETSTSKVQGGYNKEQQYLEDIRERIEGVSFKFNGLVTENVVYYTNANSIKQIFSDGSGVTGGTVDLLVREDGLPFAVYMEVHTDSGSRQTILEFTEYNNVYVGTPEWVEQVRESRS